MGINYVLLDFDGTLTDTDQEAIPYLEKWHEELSLRTGIPIDSALEASHRIKNQIVSGTQVPWMYKGHIAARASSGPYVLQSTVLRHLLDEFQGFDDFKIPSDEESRTGLLMHLYYTSYPHSGVAFKDGAKDFLDTLVDRYNDQIVIVTNSKTDSVQNKLERIGKSSIPVLGNAKKYEIDDQFEGVPETIEIEGFPWPIELRRRKYKGILDAFDIGSSAVVGDSFELDLALPGYMGMRTVQVDSPSVPQYEIDHNERKEDSCFAREFSDVIDFLSHV